MNYTVSIQAPPRSFLFLQGSASRFFGQLGGALRARGHSVNKVNFNGGDVAFWPLPDAVNYTGDLANWPAFLADLLARLNVTDIVLLGDCRPLHQFAVCVGRRLNVSVYVFEEGYLRPNWITLERGGVNALSSLGRSPEWFIQAARDEPAWREPVTAINSMARRAVEDIAYVAASAVGTVFFRGYRSHRPWSSWTEYKGGARRILRKPAARRALAGLLDDLVRDERPFFLFPLQLEADSQIRLHSRFGGVRPVVELVVESFARAAPRDAMLVITEHPLDTCPIDWARVVEEASARHGVAERVRFFGGGSPERTIQACRGVITVNSTLGYLALSLGKPLIALGKAIYGIPELTFQGGLDRFWTDGAAPSAQVFDAFRRVVAARTQVNGSFYSDAGLRLAVTGSVQRIEADAPAAEGTRVSETVTAA
jgi:capsular polysaccharide export protein